jgi:shikimate kinase
MSLQIPDRNVVLIGFMGSGKSSVGRELARRWRFRFVDTDAAIRRRFSKSIGEIFATYGEDFFREQEHDVLRDLLGQERAVIATGGGIVLQEQNVVLLRRLGRIVWLTASPDTIWERVRMSTHRPLLQNEDPRGTMDLLLQARSPLYAAAADLTVDSSGLLHSEVADRVVASLLDRRSCSRNQS